MTIQVLPSLGTGKKVLFDIAFLPIDKFTNWHPHNIAGLAHFITVGQGLELKFTHPLGMGSQCERQNGMSGAVALIGVWPEG